MKFIKEVNQGKELSALLKYSLSHTSRLVRMNKRIGIYIRSVSKRTLEISLPSWLLGEPDIYSLESVQT